MKAVYLHRLFSTCILAAALGTLPVASAQVFVQNGNSFDGTWWLSFGPPPQRPIILNIARDGAFTLVDSSDAGGHLPTGASMSPVQGSWSRSGPLSASALGLRFVFNSIKKTMGVERVRFSMEFRDNFDQISGLLQLEFMACTEAPSPIGIAVPVCPDPAVTPTQAQRGPAPYTGVRLPVNAPSN